MNPYPHNPYVQTPPPPPKKKGPPVWLLILLILPFPFLVLCGIPMLTKSLRGSKTQEARDNLESIIDAANAGGGACPAGMPEGSTGPTPELSLDCNDGPGGRCVPMVGAAGRGTYEMSAWLDDEAWSSIDFGLEASHYFHYALRWRTSSEGTCEFTALAYGDLDDDGEFSTFELSGGEFVVTDEVE